MKLGDADAPADIPAISTGSLGLDIALGVGGFPRGVSSRFLALRRREDDLTLHAIAEVQKTGGVAAFIDAEHALDLTARKLGVQADDLLVSQPDTGEQALEIAETLVRSGAIDLIVVDSVAALTPRAEIEGEMGDAHMGLQARLMSQALRKLTAAISKSQTTVIFINQIRMKLGVMFGNPETTTGGNALKFYSSVRWIFAGSNPSRKGRSGRQSSPREGGQKQDGALRSSRRSSTFSSRRGSRKRASWWISASIESAGKVRRVVFLSRRTAWARDAMPCVILVTNQPLALEIEGKLRELAGVPGRSVLPRNPCSSRPKRTSATRSDLHKVGV